MIWIIVTDETDGTSIKCFTKERAWEVIERIKEQNHQFSFTLVKEPE